MNQMHVLHELAKLWQKAYFPTDGIPDSLLMEGIRG